MGNRRDVMYVYLYVIWKQKSYIIIFKNRILKDITLIFFAKKAILITITNLIKSQIV